MQKEVYNEYKLLNTVVKKHPEYIKNTSIECENFLKEHKNAAYIDNQSQLKLLQVKFCTFAPMIIVPTNVGRYKGFGLQKGSALNGILSLE